MEKIEIKDDSISEAKKVPFTVTTDVPTTITKTYTLEELDRIIMQYTSTINGETIELNNYKALRDRIAPQVATVVSQRIEIEPVEIITPKL